MSGPAGGRRRLAVALVAVTAAGLASKLYRGPGESWLNDSLAGLFYVVFWCLASAFVFPRAPAGRIALIVLAVTCGLEVLQLWRPPWLQGVRATFLGAALLGTTFVASDFVYYLIGAAVGWLEVRWLRRFAASAGRAHRQLPGTRGIVCPRLELAMPEASESRSDRRPAGNQRPLVSLVVPAYDEESILAENLEVLGAYMAALESDYRWEMVIVDDGSSDRTGELAERFARDRDNVHVLHHRVNLGLGQALRTAFKDCRGDYVVTFDIDLSYTPDHIERLLAHIESTGASMVVASPYMSGGSAANIPWSRYLASRWANRLLSLAATTRLSTLTGMVRVYSADLLRRLDLRATGMELNPEIIHKTLLLSDRIEEIPARLKWLPHKAEASSRQSSMRMAKQTSSVLMSGFLFRPVTFLVGPGLLALVFAVWVNAWTLIHFLRAFRALPPDGWIFDRASNAVEAAFRDFPHTFVIGGIALMLAILMIGLGVLALQARAYFEELFHLGTTIHGAARRRRDDGPPRERFDSAG